MISLQIPYVIYIGNLEEISEFHDFFNLWDLYLRAQTRFFITVCFKTQAFDLYLLKNTFLKVLDRSDPNRQENIFDTPPSLGFSNNWIHIILVLQIHRWILPPRPVVRLLLLRPGLVGRVASALGTLRLQVGNDPAGLMIRDLV